MAKSTCSVPGCERPLAALGLCAPHYYRQKRTGSAQPGVPLRPPPAATLEERFWQKVEKGQSSGDCWLWQGYVGASGYGQIKVETRTDAAHRMSYKMFKGPIPEGLALDHLCRVRNCVNPDHLEAVTCRENLLRGVGLTALETRRTHCPHGHPYDEANTRRYRGRRHCRSCARNSTRAYKCRKSVALRAQLLGAGA